MELPDDMPELLKELLRKVKQSGGKIEMSPDGKRGMMSFSHQMLSDKDEDYSSWVQVGKLSGECLLAFKNLVHKGEESATRLHTLRLQAEKLGTEIEAESAQVWEMIYKANSLPHKKNYHITEDFRILMQPKGGKE